jgi:hypothetical protein
VTSALILFAVLAAAGGVVAVAAPDPRHAVAGAFGAMLLASFAADPLPGALALVARVAGAALGGWLAWIAVRSAPAVTSRSALGWAGAAAVAIVALAAGWLAALSLGTTLATPAADGSVSGIAASSLAAGSQVAAGAVGAAAALAVLAATPVFRPRDGLRLGLGSILLLAAGSLVVTALAPAPDDVTELAFALIAACAGAAVAAVVGALLRTTGDLELHDARRPDPAVRQRPADEAHRRAAR